jgi:tetratricopeptide (TPR) repeat protein
MFSFKCLMRPRTALLAGLLVVLLAVAGYFGGRRLWADSHFRAARQALERRDFDAARTHLAVCLAVWPDDTATHLLAARCARLAEHYGEAEEHLARCRALAGPTPATTLEAALLSVQRGQFGEAEPFLKRTVTPEHPDAPVVLEALALGYARTGRLLDLLEATELWLQVRPEDSQALRWQGYARERLGDSEGAWPCYERAVAADPDNDEARLLLAQMLLHLVRTQEALSHFEHLRQRRPQDPAVLLGLARCSRVLGRPDNAEQVLADLLARHPENAEALAERGKLALDADRLSEAEGWLREAVALAPDNREALFNLIHCLARLGKTEEVQTRRPQLRQLETDLARVNVLLVTIARNPNDPAPRQEVGVLCLRHGRDEEGLRWLRGALKVAPWHQPTHAALADYYERRGRPDLAAAHRRQAGLTEQRR